MRAMRAATVLLLLLSGTSACSKTEALIEPRSGIRMVRIPAGEFTMGSPPSEASRRADETPHRAKFTRSFYLGATEVTQEQWQRVMGTSPSRFRDAGANAPVEQVSWNDIQEFIRRLNKGAAGPYRLPTEAEWEYACRAGTSRAYSVGDRLDAADANHDARYPLPGQQPGEFRGKTAPVASFPPNAWGLYDMHGNVWEWCADEYCPYASLDRLDPVGRCGSGLKVIRGGSWYFGAEAARSALRYTHAPQLRGFSIGFRLARDADAED
jgi:formylglycine-generating enzyme required for sulfatase activity